MTTLFDTDDNPREPSALISLSRGEILGETSATPIHLSPTPDDVDLTELYRGLDLLRVTPAPQNLVVGQVLAAVDEHGVPLYSEIGITLPRRGSKTTSIWAELLGRCATRPDYKVVVTAQTYVKTRERFLEVARTLARHNIGAYVIKKGAAAESIEWSNGSRLWCVTPEGGSFRGDAADVIFLDEAQEHGPERTADILGGALSLMDTRPGGQIIVAGTAGKSRSGMLWDFLERGRAGQIGIVEYAVPDGVELVVDGALNEDAMLAAHPGIGTLTTMKIIRDRFEGLPLPQFKREYGGQWPFDLNSRAIDPADWKAGLVTAHPPKPERYALGFDVAPDQSSAALCAAWRDAQGHSWVEVIKHELGDAWVPKAIYEITRKSPNLRVAYDNIGPNQAVADRLEREARPRPRLQSLGTREITAAAAQIAQELRSRNLFHTVDEALDSAADLATRRNIGDGSWAWGRRRSGDISTLVAATNALKVFDADPRTRDRSGDGRVRIITGSSS